VKIKWTVCGGRKIWEPPGNKFRNCRVVFWCSPHSSTGVHHRSRAAAAGVPELLVGGTGTSSSYNQAQVLCLGGCCLTCQSLPGKVCLHSRRTARCRPYGLQPLYVGPDRVVHSGDKYGNSMWRLEARQRWSPLTA
jgi:hypothetical protein